MLVEVMGAEATAPLAEIALGNRERRDEPWGGLIRDVDDPHAALRIDAPVRCGLVGDDQDVASRNREGGMGSAALITEPELADEARR